MTINEFIKERSHLVWYTKNFDNLSKESIIEHVLNYGEWEDIQKMISILGIKKVSEIFQKTAFKKRSNYHPKTKHYFNLYFNKYAKAI